MENPVSEPISTAVQVSEPKTKFSVMYLVLSLIILALLASTIFLYYQNMQLKNMLAGYQAQPTVSPTPTIHQSPVPSNDPIANWKTYTNTKLGFEIKYPPSVQVNKEFNDQYNRATEFTGKDINFTVMLRSGYGIDVKNYFFMDAPISSTTSLAGVSANVYKMPNGYCDGPSCSAPYIAIVTVNGPDLYHLSFFGDTELSDTENQILSTFKFTN